MKDHSYTERELEVLGVIASAFPVSAIIWIEDITRALCSDAWTKGERIGIGVIIGNLSHKDLVLRGHGGRDPRDGYHVVWAGSSLRNIIS